MKVLLFIDSLNAGGAQRQMILLAKLLKEENINVELMTYNKDTFFSGYLKNLNIKVHTFDSKGKINKFLKIRNFLRKGNQDIVLSYLIIPNILSELSNIPRKKWKLIVSERNQNYGIFYWRGLFHIFCDYIVMNSNSSFKEAVKRVGPLKNKCKLIYNGVDHNYFKPSNNSYNNNSFIVVSKYSEQKNILGFLKAVNHAKEIFRANNYKVHCYGDLTKNKKGFYEVYENAKKTIRDLDIEDIVILHTRAKDIVDLYNNSDALLLPSFYEGLPNVVLEAMSCSLPVLMSKVSDYDLLVRENHNGYLFNSDNFIEISNCMKKFIELEQEERQKMGQKSLQIVRNNYSATKYLTDYLNLFREAMI